MFVEETKLFPFYNCDQSVQLRNHAAFLKKGEKVDSVITRSTYSFQVYQLLMIVYPRVLWQMVCIKVPQLS